jgi:oxalate decarboxylase
MNAATRRDLLAGAAVGAGVLLGATAANAAEQIPEPSRGPGVGGTDHAPGDVSREAENPDILNPPATDSGTLPNLRFSFADAHVRQSSGGWTRQVTKRELGVSKTIAGVNMRLNAGGVRELHWHKQAEWAYMLYGTARITAIDQRGRNFVDDVGVGDLWYFPGGIPHSIQGLGPDGCEFLLVFDDADFDEDDTFLLSDWFKHTPSEVLSKNFGVPADLFGHTPTRASCTSSKRRSRVRSARIGSWAPSRFRKPSAITCSRRSQSGPRAESCGSPIRAFFSRPKTSRPP